MSKSHVSMERHVCKVCGQLYDTGAILLDNRLRESMEARTLTGAGLCPEHQKLYDEGYVALVGVDASQSHISANDSIKPEDAYRTGDVAHVRRTVVARIFNVPIADDIPLVFCEPAVITKLQEMMGTSE